MTKYFAILLLAISLTACSNNRETRAAMMGVAAGVVLGSMVSQPNQEQHQAPTHAVKDDDHHSNDEHGMTMENEHENHDSDSKKHRRNKEHDDDEHDDKDEHDD